MRCEIGRSMFQSHNRRFASGQNQPSQGQVQQQQQRPDLDSHQIQ